MRVPTDRHPTHPGAVLLDEFLRPMGNPAEEVEWLIDARNPLDSEEAAKLFEYLGTSTGFWLSLQRRYARLRGRQRR